MNTQLTTVPAEITMLLVAFFTETATDSQKEELDEWICATDSNMRFFEHCVEQNSQPVIVNPDFAEYELTGLPPVNLN